MPWAASAAGDAGSVEVRLDDERLAIEARDASLEKILGEVGKQAGFDVVPVVGFDDPGPLDLSLDNQLLDRALKLLLDDTNHILFFAPESGEITQIWLLGRGSADAVAPVAEMDAATDRDIDAANSSTRANAVLRLANRADASGVDRIQAVLAQILTADSEPLVRTRAAQALGKIGDEDAVAALTTATRDTNATVRAQAITALGQIDSIVATDALGDILLDGNRVSLERAIAARALWRQDNSRAQYFLASGATVADAQVRRASSRPPETPSDSTSGQRGPVAVE